MIASSKLKITPQTIVFGSSNAGAEIHTEHLLPAQIMENIGKKLNLKSHKVGCKTRTYEIYTPIDLEMHKIEEDLYLLDFSRYFKNLLNLVFF